MRRILGVGVAAAVLAWGMSTAQAAPITFSGSSGNRSASAMFDTSGSNLLVTLTNTSSADALVPVDILTGVFFTLSGDPTLTRVSAVLAGGSTVLFGGTDPGGVVGGEWAYNDGIGGPGGADEGISSSGLGLFGPGDRFPGNNLQGPTSPDGLQYGITSAGDDDTTGNAAVTGSNALIQNAVVFTLSGLPGGFNPSVLGSITNVSFQYGTALNEPNIPGDPVNPGNPVPEPSTVLLLGSGLAALYWRRKKQAKA